MRSKDHTPTYLGYVIAVAFGINIFNVADRLLLGIVLEPIKAEFALSDLQLGFLSGLAFAAVYTTLGIPFGGLADRGIRRNLVAACVGIWSAMTMACGLAGGYVHLLLARMGVALGEAGFTPAIHSMLSDYFPPSRRATVLALYALGVPAGVFVGNVVGGYFAEHFGWRSAFWAVGAPGLLLALVMRTTVAEPERGRSENRSDDEPAPPLRAGIIFAWRTRSVRCLMFAAGAHLFVSYGFASWLAPFFLRSHQMSLSETGFWLGILSGVFGTIGTLVGGFASDRLGRRDERWYVWLPAMSAVLAAPLIPGLMLWPSSAGALAFGAGVSLLGATWLAPTFAVVQLVAPLRLRGVTAAVLIFTQNMIGYGCGPVVVGFASDLLEPLLGAESLRWTLTSTFAVSLLSAALYIRAGRWIRNDLRAAWCESPAMTEAVAS